MANRKITSILDLCETVIKEKVSVVTINGEDIRLSKGQQSGFVIAFILIKSLIEDLYAYTTENINTSGDENV